jgi:hypothetical protein
MVTRTERVASVGGGSLGVNNSVPHVACGAQTHTTFTQFRRTYIYKQYE